MNVCICFKNVIIMLTGHFMMQQKSNNLRSYLSTNQAFETLLKSHFLFSTREFYVSFQKVWLVDK